MNNETIIISLGGSLIIPEEIDIEFLKSFKEFILSEVSKGRKFVIVTGGGKVCRKYQNVAREITPEATNNAIDHIGISALKLNASLLYAIFSGYVSNKVVSDLSKPFDSSMPIVIGSAVEPGHSTDYDAMLAAVTVGANKLINLSNIDYVYESDPRINPNAKKFEKMSWEEYRKLIPAEWTPGLSSPFDPIASKIAHENSIEVVIMNGKPLDNLKKYLEGDNFAGTIIS